MGQQLKKFPKESAAKHISKDAKLKTKRPLQRGNKFSLK